MKKLSELTILDTILTDYKIMLYEDEERYDEVQDLKSWFYERRGIRFDEAIELVPEMDWDAIPQIYLYEPKYDRSEDDYACKCLEPNLSGE